MALEGRRFVDPDGSDTADGLTPSTALRNHQEAYNQLRTWAQNEFSNASRMFIGDIISLPGAHNLGSGLVMDNHRTVNLRSWYDNSIHGFQGFNNPGAAPILYTTGNPSNGLIHITDANTATGGFGFQFEGLRFYLDPTVQTALTGMIYTERTSFMEFVDCHFYSNGQTSQYALYQQVVGGNDNSWNKWERLLAENLGIMYQDGTTNGNNYNKMSAIWHRDLGSLSDSLDPVVSIGNGSSGLGEQKGSLYESIFSESNRTVMHVDRALDLTFMNISGQGDSYTNPVIDLESEVFRALVVGGMFHVDAAASTSGSYIRNAGSVQTIVPGLRASGSATATALKDEYEDNGGSEEHVLTLIS